MDDRERILVLDDYRHDLDVDYTDRNEYGEGEHAEDNLFVADRGEDVYDRQYDNPLEHPGFRCDKLDFPRFERFFLAGEDILENEVVENSADSGN